MGVHRHQENAWCVRVDDVDGIPRGAGVLLDDRHVLTCAHVISYARASPGGPETRVKIRSALCRPEWSRHARLVPESWVHRNDTRRGDVALLRLDEPTPCGARACLWRASISGGRVRAYGFPEAEPDGIPVDAQVGGSAGREGEWGLLKRMSTGGPWIEKGYSGAGVQALDGEFADRVIGIVVADYVNGDARAAWMLPTETILAYLPQIERYVSGRPANSLPPPGDGPPEHVLGDTLRLALTRELAGLLSGGWSGTVVLSGGATGTGTSWLVRLVRTADPAARATASDSEFTRAPRGTVLRIGAVDAAYDARGRSLLEVQGYLAARFGFSLDAPDVDDRDLVRCLLRRKPPACLVIASVDRAADPDALVRELLRPLAGRARSRGIRLVLGFDRRPPADLPYEVSLGPEPASGSFPGRATSAQAEERVTQLAAAEDAAARLHDEEGFQFFGAPPLPRCHAPQLRVRLAVARQTEPNAELAAICAGAIAALEGVASFDRELRRRMARRDDMRYTLELHRGRAERCFGAEDERLAEFYARASRALWTVPIDLAAARVSLKAYLDEVNRRIDEERCGQV